MLASFGSTNFAEKSATKKTKIILISGVSILLYPGEQLPKYLNELNDLC
jgi:hypothetical protein